MTFKHETKNRVDLWSILMTGLGARKSKRALNGVSQIYSNQLDRMLTPEENRRQVRLGFGFRDSGFGVGVSTKDARRDP